MSLLRSLNLPGPPLCRRQDAQEEQQIEVAAGPLKVAAACSCQAIGAKGLHPPLPSPPSPPFPVHLLPIRPTPKVVRGPACLQVQQEAPGSKKPPKKAKRKSTMVLPLPIAIVAGGLAGFIAFLWSKRPIYYEVSGLRCPNCCRNTRTARTRLSLSACSCRRILCWLQTLCHCLSWSAVPGRGDKDRASVPRFDVNPSLVDAG